MSDTCPKPNSREWFGIEDAKRRTCARKNRKQYTNNYFFYNSGTIICIAIILGLSFGLGSIIIELFRDYTTAGLIGVILFIGIILIVILLMFFTKNKDAYQKALNV